MLLDASKQLIFSVRIKTNSPLLFLPRENKTAATASKEAENKIEHSHLEKEDIGKKIEEFNRVVPPLDVHIHGAKAKNDETVDYHKDAECKEGIKHSAVFEARRTDKEHSLDIDEEHP